MTSILPSYTHIINPKLKYIYLRFDPDGGLIIKSPKVSQREIEKILIKKAAWITKSRQKLLNRQGRPLEFKEGERVLYLGELYPLHFENSNIKSSSLLFDEREGFSLCYSEFDPDIFTTLVEKFYKQEAQSLIPEITHHYASQMQLYPTKITFRKARSQWGSCNSTNAISFNYFMIKLPLTVIQYIVVHELAHIRYKHHQKDFWELVNTYLPDYKERQKELKKYM
ncbi:MAG: SprT family zinc-dependent metalloprotease [Campylobacterota bacterium]|nr:SprT family zinc-dependent metalloprotease [Campylobacterota bacterium]